MVKVIRYWIEFQRDGEDEKTIQKAGVMRGCGVTAYTEEDAVHLLKTKVFLDNDIPRIKAMNPNIDVNSLDEGHVRPNMGVVSVRGIWFPLGYK